MKRLFVSSCLIVALPASGLIGQPGTGGRLGKLPAADFKLAAADLDRESKDRKGAEAKYQGKVLEIRGVVDQVTDSYDGDPSYIFLQGSSTDPFEKALCRIACVVDDPNPCGKFSAGQTITLRGRFDRITIAPLLQKCEVVELGPGTALQVSAAELAKAYTADREAARAKYDSHTLILTGEIAAFKKQPELPKVEYLELKGDGETVIECRYPVSLSRPRSLKDRYKIGQTIRFACSWTTSSRRDEPKRVVVGDCVPPAERPK